MSRILLKLISMAKQRRPFARAARVSLFAAILGLSLIGRAAPTLDAAFGSNGTVVVHTFPTDGTDCPFVSQALYVQAKRDHSVLAQGAYVSQHGSFCHPFWSYVATQFGSQGTLDAAFGNAGLVYGLDPPPTRVQRDNRVVNAGPTGLIRLNSDGSPDNGFVTDGAANLAWFNNYFFTKGASLGQQADGKIVAAGDAPTANGYFSLALVRFNVDGTLDLTFNQTGAVVIPLKESLSDSVAGLAIQPDGKLVVAGSSQFATSAGATYGGITLYRYNPDGTPDRAFGNNGRTVATTSDALGPTGSYGANGVVLQPDGRLIVVGQWANLATDGSANLPGAVLLGFTSAGAPDGTFGLGGAVRIFMDGGVTASGALAQPDGKLLVTFSGFVAGTDRIMRLNRNGSVDATFGNAGVLTPLALQPINSIALQADGNLILGGSAPDARYRPTFALQRYVSGPTAAIEFYNGSLDHYFITMNPQEVGDLDLGVYPGWARTGLSFLTYGSATAGIGTSANPVCRFYIPPQHGNSHFFSADPVECAIARGKIDTDPNFSGYVEETPNAFYIGLPDQVTGACPANTTPVYRLWNQAPASNHRYTTSVAVKNQMIASGWVAEGYGPEAVDMCAPQ